MEMRNDVKAEEMKQNAGKNDDMQGYPFERVLWRMDKTIKRLWIALLIVFIVLVGTNVAWIIYEAQFYDESYAYEIQQDSGEGGTNTYTDNVVTMGGDYNGKTDDQSDN